MEANVTYEKWLKDPVFDDETKKELKGIADDKKEIEERFYKDLEFGTAGLRGIIGAGTNRMNIYTVRKATQGLANYILKTGNEKRGVAIAFDSRHMSPEFADEAALCLAANGIKAYVFESLRPTPELSFAVRFLKATAGINITASHNPPEYNGYKVYWEDGAQITPPHDKGIMGEVKAIEDYAKALTMSKEDAIAKGLYEVIGKSVDDAYIEEIKKLVIEKDAIKDNAKDLTVVYTPLHGTGNIPVTRILKELGFENVYVVPGQQLPDGDFPTVSYPNPEAKEAFALALSLAKEKDADIVLATDPDADRLGVYVKGHDGEYIALNGNKSGCLIGEYRLNRLQEKEGLPKDGAFIKSIVSTRLADAISRHYGIELVEVLTGFKYIGQKMLEFENNHNGTYLFGMEESYGCLPGDYARDKDAVAASMILCEAAAYYKSKGMSLWDAVEAMSEKYGYYSDEVISETLSGKEGLEKIANMMEQLRSGVLSDVPGDDAHPGYKLLSVKDFQKDDTGLPKSNVLYFDYSDDAWLCVRPSGTEPKIKFYYEVKSERKEDIALNTAKMGGYLAEIIAKMKINA